MLIIDYYKLLEYDEDMRNHLKELLNKVIDSEYDIGVINQHNSLVLNTLIEYDILVSEEDFKKIKKSKNRKHKIDKVLKNE